VSSLDVTLTGGVEEDPLEGREFSVGDFGVLGTKTVWLKWERMVDGERPRDPLSGRARAWRPGGKKGGKRNGGRKG